MYYQQINDLDHLVKKKKNRVVHGKSYQNALEWFYSLQLIFWQCKWTENYILHLKNLLNNMSGKYITKFLLSLFILAFVPLKKSLFHYEFHYVKNINWKN